MPYIHIGDLPVLHIQVGVLPVRPDRETCKYLISRYGGPPSYLGRETYECVPLERPTSALYQGRDTSVPVSHIQVGTSANGLIAI